MTLAIKCWGHIMWCGGIWFNVNLAPCCLLTLSPLKQQVESLSKLSPPLGCGLAHQWVVNRVKSQLNQEGRGKEWAKTETLPQSAAYSSHSDSELQPCLWSSLLNSVRVEKYSVESMAPLRYSRDSPTTTTARLAGAMLGSMCDAQSGSCCA